MNEENEQIKKVDIDSLKMTPPFESLFPLDTETYKQTYSMVYVNIDLMGLDKTQPIIVWKGKNIVIDGHTRLRAALQKGIKEVWVIEKDFLNDDDAIQYAVHLQRDRRKLTDADIFQMVRVLDKRHPPGRPPKNASTDAVSNPSTESRITKTPYTINDPPRTAFNLAINKRIPQWDDTTKALLKLADYDDEYTNRSKKKTQPQKGAPEELEWVRFQPLAGGSSKLDFFGDLRKGLAEFKEWVYGRSSDITATLIGTSSTKVEKCRYIIDSKEENADDIRDKVLRGKLTINRACSILKNNGKRGNGTDHKLKFRKGIELRTKNKSIDLDSVKWIILGTYGKPPKINQPIPKDSIICPEE
jgi:hypothetical protein